MVFNQMVQPSWSACTGVEASLESGAVKRGRSGGQHVREPPVREVAAVLTLGVQEDRGKVGRDTLTDSYTQLLYRRIVALLYNTGVWQLQRVQVVHPKCPRASCQLAREGSASGSCNEAGGTEDCERPDVKSSKYRDRRLFHQDDPETAQIGQLRTRCALLQTLHLNSSSFSLEHLSFL
jgi:hypothetical protein